MREWTQEISQQLAGLNLPPEREAEVTEELAQHLQDCYRESLEGGATEANAYRTALDEISGEKLLAKGLERIEPKRSDAPLVLGASGKQNLLAGLWQDTRYGIRILARNPGFTVVARNDAGPWHWSEHRDLQHGECVVTPSASRQASRNRSTPCPPREGRWQHVFVSGPRGHPEANHQLVLRHGRGTNP